MGNIFTVNDIDSELLKKEKEQESLRSVWDDDKQDSEKGKPEPDSEFLSKFDQNSTTALSDTDAAIQKHVESERAKDDARKKRFEIKVPDGYKEIELYDDCKSFDENFKNGQSKKYILIEVNKNDHFTIANPQSILPTSQSKCIIDIKKVEEYNSLEFIPIDYDTFWGLRFLTFIKYKSDFFSCDERVIFEALLIKYKAFDFKPFYWSLEKIYEEVGIKKDRSNKILDRFIELGIIGSKTLKKTIINNRPHQINYYDLEPYTIIKLIPQIFKERENIDIENQIRTYLSPAINRYSSSKMQ